MTPTDPRPTACHAGAMTDPAPAAPITGPRYDTVTRELLTLARSGDWRARHVTINGRSRIITPHRTPEGDLDADDLAAQTYALCHDLTSDDGTYTEGVFTADGAGYYIAAPLD